MTKPPKEHTEKMKQIVREHVRDLKQLERDYEDGNQRVAGKIPEDRVRGKGSN